MEGASDRHPSSIRMYALLHAGKGMKAVRGYMKNGRLEWHANGLTRESGQEKSVKTVHQTENLAIFFDNRRREGTAMPQQEVTIIGSLRFVTVRELFTSLPSWLIVRPF